MKKIHLKRKYYISVNLKHKILFLLLLTSLTTFFTFRYINNRFTPILMEHAESELKRISLYIINESINDEVIEDINFDELYVTNKDNDTINSIDFNTYTTNKILKKVNSNIWNNLNALQTGNLELLNIDNSIFSNSSDLKKGVITKIPLGVVYNNPLFNNLGPKIPIKLSLSGNINSYIETNVKNYGINNAIIEITINIEVEERVLLPFASKKIKVTNEVPLAIKIIEGSIPDYYASGIKENSPIISTLD